MGTTESLPYDDSSHDGQQVSSSSSSRPVGNTNEASSRVLTHPASLVPPPSREGVSQRPQRRRHAPQKAIVRINGLVLGDKKTGKTTLLQRLNGEDPFAPSRSRSHLDKPTSILIPYVPPSLAWDRIQLHVQIPQHFPKEKVDFVAILLHPQRQTLAEIAAYLIQTLSPYLQSRGYRHSNTSETMASPNTVDSRKPISICILFNFRDLQQQQVEDGESSSPPHWGPLKEQLQEMLETFGCPKSQINLRLVSTCLRNCYGLNVLHAFIYRTYLLGKQSDLESQLAAVSQQLDHPSCESECIPYSDFIQLLNPSPSKSMNQNKSETEATSATSREKEMPRTNNPRPNGRPTVAGATNKSQPTTEHPPTLAAPTTNRSNHGSGRRQVMTPIQPVRVGKDALEAFLASDRDDDNEPPPSQQVRTQKKVQLSNVRNDNHSSDGDNDDDDDFFYDERGHRRVNHPTLQRYSSASSEDEMDEHDDTPVATFSPTRDLKKIESSSSEKEIHPIAPHSGTGGVSEAETHPDEDSNIGEPPAGEQLTGSASLSLATDTKTDLNDSNGGWSDDEEDFVVEDIEDTTTPTLDNHADLPAQTVSSKASLSDVAPRTEQPSPTASESKTIPAVTKPVKQKAVAPPIGKHGEDDSEDDEEFFVGDTLSPKHEDEPPAISESNSASIPDHVPTKTAAALSEPSSSERSSTVHPNNYSTPVGSSVSEAARVAIEAARKEAEQMLVEQQQEQKEISTKKKKSEKKKKKKKAKPKEKQQGAQGGLSATS